MNGHGSSRFMLSSIIALTLILTSTPNRVVQAAAGDLDPTFGSGGKTFIPQTGVATAIALQSDGKIITVGTSEPNLNLMDFNRDFVVERFTKDGVLDPTFGSGGKVTTDISSLAGLAAVVSVAVQNDGRVVVAAKVLMERPFPIIDVGEYGLWRYNPDGSLDGSFGSGGHVFGLIGFECGIEAMKLDDAGRIVVAGEAITERCLDCPARFSLARHNSNGSLDPTFGSGGIVFGGVNGPTGGAFALAIQPNGKLTVVGRSAHLGLGVDFAVLRYNGDGSIDMSFAGGNEVNVDFLGGDDIARAVVVQPDGKIIVGGTTTSNRDFALARLNSNGSLDSTFGSGGKLLTDYYQDRDDLLAMVLQSNSKLVAAGGAVNDNAVGLALARYDLGLPLYDLCVQDDGSGSQLQVNTTTGEYQFTNCGGLTIGGTGTVTKRGSTITLQHTSGDRRVTATIDTASGKATATLQLFAQGRTFSITDRNINNNTCACR